MLLLSGTAFGYLRAKLDGPDLGDKIASLLNKRMRGRIEIGSIEWQTSSLRAVVSGGWVPVVVHDVKVWDDCVLSAEISKVDQDDLHLGDPNEDCTPDDKPDPDPKSKRKPRKLLLTAPLITADVDIHALMFGHHDFVFRNLWIHGGEALLEQTREPYPLHAYNRTIVSIVTAFYPRMKAGFRAGIYAETPPPIFDLRDMHVEGLNLTVHMGPYTNKDNSIGFLMTARVTDVNADADPAKPLGSNYLHMDGTDPLVAKFYVRLALRGAHGRIRIFDDGPRTSFHIPHDEHDEWAKGRDAWYDIELSDIVLHRLAQLPTDWARHNYVANTLELDLSAHTIPCKTETDPNPSSKDGADIHASGELDNYWDTPYGGNWNLALDVKNLGPTLRSCIKSKMGGDNLGGRMTLTGPFIALPKVTFDLHGLDFDVPLSKQVEPLRLTLAEVHGDVDLVNEQGSIEKTKALIRGGKEPGEVMVSATFGVKPYNGKASIDIVKPIDVGRFLPGQIATSVGRYLAGKLTASGDVDYGFALEDFDLTLAPTPTDKLVRVHRGRIFTNDDFDTVQIQKVAVEAGRSHAIVDGHIDTIHPEETDINLINPDFPDLGVWLKRFGLPAFAASAGGGTITIHGPLTAPRVGILQSFGGVPCMDNLRLDAEIQNQVATIHHVSSTGLGGKIDGHGVVALSTPKVIEKFHLEGRNLDATRLCGLPPGIIKGTLDTIDLDVKRTAIVANRTPLDWLSSFVMHTKATHLTVENDPYSNVALCINHPDDDKLCRGTSQQARLGPDDVVKCNDAKLRGGACVVGNAQRDHGGTIAATVIDIPSGRTGRVAFPRKLGGTIAVDDIPLTVLEQFVGKDVLGGLFSATLHLSSVDGKPTSPLAEGNLYLTHSWITRALIGDAQMQIDPIMIGRMPSLFVHGSALAGQVGVSATIGTEPPYPVDVSITGRRVEVDQFVDLSKKLGVSEPIQAWASGSVTLRTELAPLNGKPAQPEAWVEITELEGILDHRSREGRTTPLRFKLRPATTDPFAMSLRVTPATIELACRDVNAPKGRRPCPARLDTPAGVVTIEGNATQSQTNLHATGNLDLRRLSPLLESQLDDITGSLDLDAIVTGTFDAPKYQVELAIHDQINVVPTGVDTTLQILPGGQLKLADGILGINQLKLTVKDPHANEQGALNIKGTIGLAGFKPATWGLLIDGQIAGKMLLAIAPNAFSAASGLATIDGSLSLSGHGALPEVNGSVSFDPAKDVRATPLSVIPRGVRKEIELLGGSIDISTASAGEHRTYTLKIADNPLTASFDGEGKLLNIVGAIVLADGVPVSARLGLDAENIPFRQPGTLDLIVSAKDISLELPAGASAWHARGDVSIVSGKYQRNFDLTQAIKREPPDVTPVKPLWDVYPSIGNADLDLTLEVRKFAVEDNIASIDLEGPHILITGSPRDLRLSGSIRVQRGEFQIPGTRAKFTRTTGSIDFSENEHAGNPKLEVTSEADFLDLSGQLHIIKLAITGTLDRRQWDLTTSTGYDKSQTLALLFLGRNPEQLRRSLGDQSLGTNPTQVEATTNPSSTFADQIVKDLAGQWVSDLLGDSLTKITRLDVLRFEVGFGSVGFHAEKKAVESIKLTGDGEQTIRGTTINGTVEIKTPYHLPWGVVTDDHITVQGVALRKNYSDPAEQDQNYQDIKGQLVYRLFIP